jgi:uncharacterized UPF0160 family protein
MTAQHKALQLADLLETAGRLWEDEAAEELRRLHQSEKEAWRYADELEQERKRLIKAAEMVLETQDENYGQIAKNIALSELRQTLKQPVDAVNMSQESVDEMAKHNHEPVGYVTDSGASAYFLKGVDLDDDTPLYTAPREWVGLTDGEIDLIFDKHFNRYAERGQAWPLYEREIEAKLKEKNT